MVGELSLKKDIKSEITWCFFVCLFLVCGRNIEAECIQGLCAVRSKGLSMTVDRLIESDFEVFNDIMRKY